MQYYFILGKNPVLSNAEICSVLQISDILFQSPVFFGKVMIIDVKKKLDVEEINQRLGGTIKIGQVLDEVKDLQNFENRFLDLVKIGEHRVHFGFSLYPLISQINLKKVQGKLSSVAMEIKRKLREEKHLNSRWVISKEVELSSVIVKKNKLLKDGAEICLFLDKNKIIVGQTLAVQLFEEFGARDYNRPGRDDVSGMIPPKLAKIMLNLAQIKDKNAVILDPFCGSGTILQEALLMGYGNLIGFDNSDKAIEDTRKNIDWVFNKFKIQNTKIKIKKVDVRNLSKELEQKSVEAIVTEPFLGPPIKGNESEQKVKQIILELEDLYLQAFVEFAGVLKKKGKVVIVTPYFKKYNLSLDIANQITKLGFVKINKDVLLYYREKQHVWRRINIWQKK